MLISSKKLKKLIKESILKNAPQQIGLSDELPEDEFSDFKTEDFAVNLNDPNLEIQHDSKISDFPDDATYDEVNPYDIPDFPNDSDTEEKEYDNLLPDELYDTDFDAEGNPIYFPESDPENLDPSNKEKYFKQQINKLEKNLEEGRYTGKRKIKALIELSVYKNLYKQLIRS